MEKTGRRAVKAIKAGAGGKVPAAKPIKRQDFARAWQLPYRRIGTGR